MVPRLICCSIPLRARRQIVLRWTATNYTGTKELTVEEDGTLRNLVGAYAIKDDEAGHFTLKDDTDTYEYAYNSSGGGYVIQEKTPVSTGHSHDDGVAYDNELTADSSGNLLSNGVKYI